MGAQLAARIAELALARRRLTADEAGLESNTAEAAARTAQLASVDAALADKQRQLSSIEGQLRVAAAELAEAKVLCGMRGGFVSLDGCATCMVTPSWAAYFQRSVS